MTKFFFYLALTSLVLLSSCAKQEIEDTSIQITNEVDPALEDAKVEFSIDNNKAEVFENDDLLLTNLSENAVSYLWDFGNGDTSTEANPAYVYERHGVYTVKLVITDRNGDEKESSHDVTVICLFEGQIHTSGN